MNQEHHWNAIAKKYNEEIFDVFASDKKQRLQLTYRLSANDNH